MRRPKALTLLRVSDEAVNIVTGRIDRISARDIAAVVDRVQFMERLSRKAEREVMSRFPDQPLQTRRRAENTHYNFRGIHATDLRAEKCRVR